jgi:hypothetical protein
MLPVSLYCIRIESCAQCYRCLCIVFVLSLVPNVTGVSVLYSYWVLCPMLPVSLYRIQYRNTGNVGHKTQYEYNTETLVTLGTRLNTIRIESCAQCYRCLCIVHSYWVLCPVLPVSLYCPFVLSFVPNVTKTQYEYNTETLVTLATRLNTNTIQRHR